MKKLFVAIAAVVSIFVSAFGAVTGVLAAPTSVVIGLTSPFSSLNPLTPDTYTASNQEIWNLTSAHFNYVGDQGFELPTQLGSLEVLTNTPSLFQVKQTINPGNLWSDGTRIDAVDLLLKFVVSSSAYSIQAGLGNPAQATPAFNSLIYGSSFDTKIIGEPSISPDRMSLTYSFTGYFTEWQNSLTLAQPAHALEMLVFPELTAANAKNQFLNDFLNKDTVRLSQLGSMWSSGYSLQNISSNSSPNLFVSSGQYRVDIPTPTSTSITAVQVNTFAAMPKSPITQVVLKSFAGQGAANSALRDREIDIFYPGSLSSAFLLCMGLSGVNCTPFQTGAYSFVNLRVAASVGGATYAGPFSGDSAQARDLRRAFLLSIPTENIDQNICKLHSSSSSFYNPTVRISSPSRMPTSAAFTQGFSDGIYKSKTLAERQTLAKAIVQQYFPNWDGTQANAPVSISMNFSITSAARVSTFQLIKASAAQSGFNLTPTTDTNVFGNLNSSQYDAQMYAFGFAGGSTGSDILTSSEIYGTGGGSNTSGWSNAGVDSALASLINRPLTMADDAALAALATAIQLQYWTLPICQTTSFYGSVSNLYLNHDQTAFAQAGEGIVGRHFGWSFDVPLAVIPNPGPSVSSAPASSSSPSVSSAPASSSSPSVSSAPVVSATPSATVLPIASPTPTFTVSPKPSPTASISVPSFSVPASAITLPAGSTVMTKSVTAKLQSYAKSLIAGKYTQVVIPVKTQGTTLARALAQGKEMAKVLTKSKVKATVTVSYTGSKVSVRVTARK